MEKKLEFYLEDTKETVSFYVLEETRINNINYLLVTESDEDDAEAYILKDLADAEDAQALYEIVEDDEELNLVGKIFAELLDEDVELQ
ncbi:MAG: DUF1292 domain-containing protein [Lachnospiraceae bacterium]|nr:DUF1292 domain-containing protein [Lachnospiraceae bacterium]